MSLSVDRISGINIERMSPTFPRNRRTLDVPMGYSQVFGIGVGAETFSLQCNIRRHTDTSASAKAQQLQELFSNPDWQIAYLQFPTNYTKNDGFYFLDSISLPSEFWHAAQIFPITLTVTRLGAKDQLRLAERWTGFSEKIKGWTTLPTVQMAAAPVNSTLNDDTIANNRTASDGIVPTIQTPNASLLTFKPSTTIADWFLGDCRVYDSIVAGDSASGNWAQVFSKEHRFFGDTIFQNGLLRYNGTQMWAWNTSSSAWANFGSFATNQASAIGFDIDKITPSSISWRETRKMSGGGVARVDFNLRRGAQFLRAKVSTKTVGLGGLDIWGISSSGTLAGSFFHSSSSGTNGSGGLAVDSACNFEAAFSTASPLVWGLILTEQPPTNQPRDTNGSFLGVNTAIAVSACQIVFVFAMNQVTTPIVISTARTNIGTISQEALAGITQETVYVGAGYF